MDIAGPSHRVINSLLRASSTAPSALTALYVGSSPGTVAGEAAKSMFMQGRSCARQLSGAKRVLNRRRKLADTGSDPFRTTNA